MGTRSVTTFFFSASAFAVMLCSGCHANKANPQTETTNPFRRSQPEIRRVVCLFDQRPWLNADAAGDRDPEGLHYRVYLDDGSERGVTRDGTFHVFMYRIRTGTDGKQERVLASDWHYPAKNFTPVFAKILGNGYHLRLRWATKDIAGNDVELITEFEDPQGRRTRSGTKRLRVPKYVN